VLAQPLSRSGQRSFIDFHGNLRCAMHFLMRRGGMALPATKIASFFFRKQMIDFAVTDLKNPIVLALSDSGPCLCARV
jgi:hypothetical protein